MAGDPRYNQAPPSRAELVSARARLLGHAHETPIFTSRTLDTIAGARLFFKAENLQKVGAFKYRGAYNTIASMSAEERAAGIITQSSGNHAQAVALAAREHGVPAHIVMPHNAPAVKIAAVRGYGAEIVFCEHTPAARDRACEEVLASRGGQLVHPYDDARVLAGQSTATQELLEQVPDLEIVITPVSGGGLLSGTALAARAFGSGVKVVGAEPDGADDAHRSLKSGQLQKNDQVDTIADGLRAQLSPLTFGVISREVEDIVTVGEHEIVHAMRLVWERMKLVIEPSAAVAVAVVLRGSPVPGAKRIGVLLSGGNVDLQGLPF